MSAIDDKTYCSRCNLPSERCRCPDEPSSLGPAAGSPSGIEDSVCVQCGRVNIVWFTPSKIWNAVMRDGDKPEPFVCPACFAIAAAKKGIVPTAWKLIPEDYNHLTLDAEKLRNLTVDEAVRHALALGLKIDFRMVEKENTEDQP